MYDWKSQLHGLLAGLARTHGNSPLSEIQRILDGVLHVEGVTFHGQDGQELPAETPLRAALEEACELRARLECAAAVPADAGGMALTDQQDGLRESRFRESTPTAEAGDPATDTRFTRFLLEFLRLEQHHDFMWAGYIVRELLPRIGFAAEEAKGVLDLLRAENLVTITKVPNPKNPDFPATGVRLNHDHPRVRALLGEEPPAAEEVGAEEVEAEQVDAEPNEPVSG